MASPQDLYCSTCYQKKGKESAYFADELLQICQKISLVVRQKSVTLSELKEFILHCGYLQERTACMCNYTTVVSLT